MKKIAFVTFRRSSKLNPGDALLVEPFARAGYRIDACPWDDEHILWQEYTAIIIRSSWNYHLHYIEFCKWLDRLEKFGIPVFNPVDIIRWNSNKKYLLDVKKHGISIIPTVYFSSGGVCDIAASVQPFNCEDFIIKPSIGASAHNVEKFSVREIKQAQIRATGMLSHGDIIVQPFIREVSGSGELSLLYFNKIFSHAVLKKPKKGEYRTQPEFGGSEEHVNLPDGLITQGDTIVQSVESPLLYARVDAVNIGGVLHLMELELIEPYLFFEFDKASPERFISAFQNLMK